MELEEKIEKKKKRRYLNRVKFDHVIACETGESQSLLCLLPRAMRMAESPRMIRQIVHGWLIPPEINDWQRLDQTASHGLLIGRPENDLSICSHHSVSLLDTHASRAY